MREVDVHVVVFVVVWCRLDVDFLVPVVHVVDWVGMDGECDVLVYFGVVLLYVVGVVVFGFLWLYVV